MRQLAVLNVTWLKKGKQGQNKDKKCYRSLPLS